MWSMLLVRTVPESVCFMYVCVHTHLHAEKHSVVEREREGVRKKYKPKTYGAHTLVHAHANVCVCMRVYICWSVVNTIVVAAAAVIVVVALVLFCLIQQRIQEKKGKEKQIQLLTHTLLQLLKNAATALWFSYSLPSRRTHQHNKHTYTKCMHTYTSHTQ